MLGLGCQQCPLPSPLSASDRKVINTDEAIIRLVLVLVLVVLCLTKPETEPPLHHQVTTTSRVHTGHIVRRNREDELFGEGSVYFLLYFCCRGPEYLELAAARRGRSTGRIMVPLQHCSTAALQLAALQQCIVQTQSVSAAKILIILLFPP